MHYLRVFQLFAAFLLLCFLQTAFVYAQGCVTLFAVTAPNTNTIEPVRIDSLDGDLAVITSIQSSSSALQVAPGSFTVNSLQQELVFLQTTAANSNIKTVNALNGNPGTSSPNVTNLLEFEYHCEADKLYALQRVTVTSYRLVEVNPATAATTPIGAVINLPVGNTLATEISAIDIVSNRFFFFSRNGGIYTLHVAPLDGSAATNFSLLPFEPVDAEFNVVTGELLIFTVSLQLATINPATGAANLQGVVAASPVSLPVNNGALDPFTNRYFFVAEQTPGNFALYTVNAVNAAQINPPVLLPASVSSLTASVPCQAQADFSADNSCLGANTQFTDLSVGAGQWNWNFGDPASGAANTSTQQNPSHLYASAGTYTVTLNISGCVGVSSVTQNVTIVAPPTANFPSDTLNTCTGIVTAQNYPGATYFWITGASSNQITATVDAWYWVDITLSGCTVRDSIYVNVDSSAGSSQIWNTDELTFCQGEPVTLNTGITGATAYQWSTGATTPTINVTTQGLYSVTVSSGPCVTTDAVTVNFAPQPTVNLGSDATICDTGYVIDPAIGTPGLVYEWSNGSSLPTLSVTQSGVYSVTVSLGTCSDADTISLTLIPLATPDLGGDTLLVCENNPLTLDATASGVPGAGYLWSTGADTPTLTVTGNQSGLYWVQVSASSCTVSDSVQVVFTPAITVNLGGNQDLCQGNTLTLDAGTAANASYTWSNGQTTQQITISDSGTYTVTVTNGGCTQTDAATITLRTPAAINLGENLSVCTLLNESITLSAGEGSSYLWQPGGQTTPEITVSQPGAYSVTVTDAFGCTASAQAEVVSLCKSALVFPTAFSPNDDGENDIFLPFSQFIDTYQFKIYNRWGNLLFESDETDDGWDGTRNGEVQPIGVYVWYAVYTDESGAQTTTQGNVTLIR
ncbi:PKD domain-containing protein [Sphingobacteriales bacterium UPWRP_1]|nr:PKD domain-containing protein [Sphingobacteriales bacterium UPWRP_1]